MGATVDPWQPGQLLFVGFEGERVPTDLERLVRAGRIGGVVLFARNLGEPRQIRALAKSLRELSPEGAELVVAIDQEGGRVQRLPAPWTRWPSARELGERGDPGHTRAVAAALGRELADLGIALDFAPVVDVDTNPENPVIGDRSFGRDPETVSVHATAFAAGLADAGVRACAKHFPGHGDTALDSHLALPSVTHDLARLRRVELPPFAAAIAAGVASIMTAHVVFPAIDRKRPATLSPEVMAILREELKYSGLVFSDDLEMKAMTDHFTVEQRVTGCLEASVDALLVCRHADLRDEVLARLESAPDRRVEAALGRMVAFKRARPVPAVSEATAPYDEHRDLLAAVRGA